MLMKSLGRLEEIIDQEIAALTARNYGALEELNRSKSQSLLEVTRLVRVAPAREPGSALAERIIVLRDRLEKSHAMLEQHMRAVREVDALITHAIQKANSDGTYSAAGRHHGAGL